ncbi:MAG: hypothetical protein J6T80_05075 [Paludibacteraceae bacterium]|nr:hypothetical protein [Paludibacteraceae bacterium]
MCCEIWLNIATIASPIIGAIAIIVALCVSRKASKDAQKQIDEIRKSTNEQINALKDIVAHQGDIEWGHLQHYYQINEFELVHEENELAYVNFRLEHLNLFGQKEKNELKIEADILAARIKNRKIMRDNYRELLKGLNQSTTSILFEQAPNPKI